MRCWFVQISYTFGYLVFIAIDMDDPFDGGMVGSPLCICVYVYAHYWLTIGWAQVDLPLEKYEAGLNRDLNVVNITPMIKLTYQFC